MYRIHVESYAQSTHSHLYEMVKKKKRYASSLLHINQKKTVCRQKAERKNIENYNH